MVLILVFGLEALAKIGHRRSLDLPVTLVQLSLTNLECMLLARH